MPSNSIRSSIRGIADLINKQSNAPVRASVVKDVTDPDETTETAAGAEAAARVAADWLARFEREGP